MGSQSPQGSRGRGRASCLGLGMGWEHLGPGVITDIIGESEAWVEPGSGLRSWGLGETL